MRYRNVIIFLGFVSILIQVLNFPHSWERAFYIAIGALIIAFGYLSRERKKEVRAETPEIALNAR